MELATGLAMAVAWLAMAAVAVAGRIYSRQCGQLWPCIASSFGRRRTAPVILQDVMDLCIWYKPRYSFESKFKSGSVDVFPSFNKQNNLFPSFVEVEIPQISRVAPPVLASLGTYHINSS